MLDQQLFAGGGRDGPAACHPAHERSQPIGTGARVRRTQNRQKQSVTIEFCPVEAFAVAIVQALRKWAGERTLRIFGNAAADGQAPQHDGVVGQVQPQRVQVPIVRVDIVHIDGLERETFELYDGEEFATSKSDGFAIEVPDVRDVPGAQHIPFRHCFAVKHDRDPMLYS